MESIVRIALKFLTNATKHNVESSTLLFQQLSVCIKFLGLNIGAEDFFHEFFEKNLHLHSKSDIPFTAIIEQYRSLKLGDDDFFPDMFKVFTPLMRDSEEEGNANNQTILFDMLVVKKSHLLLPIFNVNDRLFVHFKGQSTELEAFVRSMAVLPHIVQMVIKQIDFFGDLVFGRNYVCSKHFKEVFAFRSIMSYLQGELNVEVKASLLQLLIMCFIDERPRFRETFPTLTYSFMGEISASTGIDSRAHQDEQEKEHQKQKRKYEDVIELTRTRSMNLQENVIRELLETISLKDSITAA